MKARGLTFFLTLWLGWGGVAAADLAVDGVRVWDAPDSTRVVFDLTGAVNPKVFSLPSPARVVLDFDGTRLAADLPEVHDANPVLKSIRGARRHGDDYRVVLDLRRPVTFDHFTLKPNKEYGHRLVVDLEKPAAVSEPAPRPARTADDEPRDVVVAVDAGHGGEDPGAHGRHGTQEKNVVLAISRRLARLIDREPGMRAVLIRDGDYYLSLRERIKKARAHKADLFVSVHADAFRNPRVKGSSVYVLSAKGASDEAARWLAERENAADLVGGVSLTDKDDVLASVLLDLSLTGTIDASTRAADRVLDQIASVTSVHKRSVQYAGFVVLKSPDIPSLLVETAFISNPREERRLNNRRYQQKLAGAMMRGVREYFIDHPPPGTVLAERSDRSYVVRRGDTLSEVAQRYQVSLSRLKGANRLDGDVLRVGQVLAIP